MLELQPVIEMWGGRDGHDWAPAPDARAFIVLHGGASDDDVASVVGILASYNDVGPASSAADAVAALVAKADENGLIAPGGLQAREGDLDIAPSCCCGLEHWRTWQGLAPASPSPWLGHDPSPWIECRDDGALIWEDGGTDNDAPDARAIRTTYAEIEAQAAHASVMLAAFRDRLSQWLRTHGCDEALSQRFSDIFHVD